MRHRPLPRHAPRLSPRRAARNCLGHLLPALFALPLAFQFFPARSALAGPPNEWRIGSGNWNAAANWTLSHVPVSNEIVNIAPTDGVSRTITYDFNRGPVTLDTLTINLDGGIHNHTTTLSMAANTLSCGVEIIGYSATGSSGNGTFLQSGGTNNVEGTLFVRSECLLNRCKLHVGWSEGLAGTRVADLLCAS